MSSKVLPHVDDSAALSEALARACEDPSHPLRAAVETQRWRMPWLIGTTKNLDSYEDP
jgi:hypothetical protein